MRNYLIKRRSKGTDISSIRLLWKSIKGSHIVLLRYVCPLNLMLALETDFDSTLQCGHVVMNIKEQKLNSKDVVECVCSKKFCFHCGLEYHNPVTCKQVCGYIVADHILLSFYCYHYSMLFHFPFCNNSFYSTR